jgi:hypothetical protein
MVVPNSSLIAAERERRQTVPGKQPTIQRNKA